MLLSLFVAIQYPPIVNSRGIFLYSKYNTNQAAMDSNVLLLITFSTCRFAAKPPDGDHDAHGGEELPWLRRASEACIII